MFSPVFVCSGGEEGVEYILSRSCPRRSYPGGGGKKEWVPSGPTPSLTSPDQTQLERGGGGYHHLVMVPTLSPSPQTEPEQDVPTNH